MAGAPTGELASLIGTLQSLAGTVLQRFGPLSAAQLNWKPAADQWRVAQCLDHLVTDAFRIVVRHGQRHVNQAIRVTEAEGFRR
jgi:hypothetical protein